MMTEENNTRPAFVWNAGGWFGSQLGCTLWILILGLVLLSKDLLAAWICIAAFMMLNIWGVSLWRRRGQLSAYAAIQRFLLAASLVVAVVVVVVNGRGVSEPPAAGALISTSLPYWVIGVAPILMGMFFLRQRAARQSHR